MLNQCPSRWLSVHGERPGVPDGHATRKAGPWSVGRCPQPEATWLEPDVGAGVYLIVEPSILASFRTGSTRTAPSPVELYALNILLNSTRGILTRSGRTPPTPVESIASARTKAAATTITLTLILSSRLRSSLLHIERVKPYHWGPSKTGPRLCCKAMMRPYPMKEVESSH